ncbi:hypothetical protein [Mesorhizobium cantuariense]|uniref:Uncharacterized protein n=1 Tax=Mesorhizobium cantuariense TaxID=1300275 RepID=A0ABV7MP15_9HYPH
MSAAMSGYEFTVTINHPKRHDEEDFFLDPNGATDIEMLQNIADALAPFIDDKPPKMK